MFGLWYGMTKLRHMVEFCKCVDQPRSTTWRLCHGCIFFFFLILVVLLCSISLEPVTKNVITNEHNITKYKHDTSFPCRFLTWKKIKIGYLISTRFNRRMETLDCMFQFLNTVQLICNKIQKLCPKQLLNDSQMLA